MKIWKALSILNVVLCATILAYFIVSDVPSSPFILGHNNFPQTIIKKLIGGLFLSLGYPFVFLIFGLMLFNSLFALEKIKNPLPILSVISVAVLLAGIASTMNNQFGGIIGTYISELIKKIRNKRKSIYFNIIVCNLCNINSHIFSVLFKTNTKNKN